MEFRNWNNFLFFPSHGHALCKRPVLFAARCVIAMNVRTSSLISTTIILSLCARHNYNHLPHNYNFKTLYRGASFWQGNNWWEVKGDVCIPGMERLDERRMVPLLVSITNIKTCVRYKTQLFQTAQFLYNVETLLVGKTVHLIYEIIEIWACCVSTDPRS